MSRRDILKGNEENTDVLYNFAKQIPDRLESLVKTSDKLVCTYDLVKDDIGGYKEELQNILKCVESVRTKSAISLLGMPFATTCLNDKLIEEKSASRSPS